MPDTDPAEALRTWSATFEGVLNDLAKAESRLQAMQRLPTGGEPAARLVCLNKVWYTLAGRDRPPFPPEDACDQLQKDVAAARVVLPRASGLPCLLKVVATEITRMLEEGAHDPEHPVVRSADFNAEPFYHFSGPGTLMDLSTPTLAGFLLEHLPDRHWLQTALPDGEWYLLDGKRPAVILGEPDVFITLGRRPKPLYTLADTLFYTREARRRQREDQARREWEKAERERLEQRRREQQDPAHQIEVLRRRITELESRNTKKKGK
jgi:hypothetical protein